MTLRGRRPSLRSQIVLWYSLVLVVALSLFALLTYLLMAQALERAGAASLRQTAEAAEQLVVPGRIPRLWTSEQPVESDREGVETLRRRTRLATGEIVEIYVARSDDVEERALRSFLLIAAILIPLTAAAAALGGRALAERLLEPLSRLVGATREIGIGGLSRRVREPDEPAELQELAHAYNGMLTRLERAVEALRRFTADASHELRTPLTAIRGTIQVALARERSAAELRETLVEVSEETEWMLHLVDGLLTLARGEENATLPHPGEVDLVPLLEDVREVGGALATGREVEVRLSAPERLTLSGSAGQLRQVFLNLVSNAIRFTERGSVTISAREGAVPTGVRNPGGGRWASVSVADTGVGIAPEELPLVFDRFYRGDAARSRQGGTGLGLAIARLLVEQHGGTITVESALGQGTTFTVYLPLTRETPRAVGPSGPAPGPG